jgi:hypothetical protein
MTENDAEISLFQVADWLWSFRWLMLACAIGAIGWAGVAWQNNSPATSFDIKLQIFSGGTPVRRPDEIADILVAGLGKPGLQLVSSPAQNPVIFRASDGQLANSIEEDVAGLTDAMMIEVREQQTELVRLLPTNETALPHFLRTKAFIEGVNSGLIAPVLTTVSSSEATARSRANVVLLPIVVCGLLFFLTAGAISFGRTWKKRREVI